MVGMVVQAPGYAGGYPLYFMNAFRLPKVTMWVALSGW